MPWVTQSVFLPHCQASVNVISWEPGRKNEFYWCLSCDIVKFTFWCHATSDKTFILCSGPALKESMQQFLLVLSSARQAQEMFNHPVLLFLHFIQGVDQNSASISHTYNLNRGRVEPQLKHEFFECLTNLANDVKVVCLLDEYLLLLTTLLDDSTTVKLVCLALAWQPVPSEWQVEDIMSESSVTRSDSLESPIAIHRVTSSTLALPPLPPSTPQLLRNWSRHLPTSAIKGVQLSNCTHLPSRAATKQNCPNTIGSPVDLATVILDGWIDCAREVDNMSHLLLSYIIYSYRQLKLTLLMLITLFSHVTGTTLRTCLLLAHPFLFYLIWPKSYNWMLTAGCPTQIGEHVFVPILRWSHPTLLVSHGNQTSCRLVIAVKHFHPKLSLSSSQSSSTIFFITNSTLLWFVFTKRQPPTNLTVP